MDDARLEVTGDETGDELRAKINAAFERMMTSYEAVLVKIAEMEEVEWRDASLWGKCRIWLRRRFER